MRVASAAMDCSLRYSCTKATWKVQRAFKNASKWITKQSQEMYSQMREQQKKKWNGCSKMCLSNERSTNRRDDDDCKEDGNGILVVLEKGGNDRGSDEESNEGLFKLVHELAPKGLLFARLELIETVLSSSRRNLGK
jgi:hypothetical protein